MKTLFVFNLLTVGRCDASEANKNGERHHQWTFLSGVSKVCSPVRDNFELSKRKSVSYIAGFVRSLRGL